MTGERKRAIVLAVATLCLVLFFAPSGSGRQWADERGERQSSVKAGLGFPGPWPSFERNTRQPGGSTRWGFFFHPSWAWIFGIAGFGLLALRRRMLRDSTG